MEHHNQILRFQEGTRSQHPSAEIMVTGLTPHRTEAAGGELVIMVDLTPPLPQRSREIRAIAAQTYQTSSGSVVARLRRALAEANRYLVHLNMNAAPGAKCAGSLTCAVFEDNELFLGQIGAAYACVHHPDGRFETFPRRTRLLMPLGGALPPVINIGYTTLEEDCVALLATTPIAESQTHERWQELLATASVDTITPQIIAALAQSGASGSLALIHLLAEKSLAAQPTRPSHFWERFSGLRKTPPTESLPPALPTPETFLPTPEEAQAVVPLSARGQIPIQEPELSAPLPAFLQRRLQQRAAATTGEPPSTAKKFPLPAIHLPPLRTWLHDLFRKQAHPRTRATTAERARLHHALLALLPGRLETAPPPKVRPAPQENTPIMGGVTLGVFLIILFITLTEYWQSGGTQYIFSLLDTAQTVRQTAYTSQEAADWQRLLDLSNRIVTRDPRNQEAKRLKEEAQQAIAALKHAAMLDVRPLLELSVAPTPRRLLVTERWLYVLDTANDEVIGLEMQTDYLTPTTGAPLTLLKYGQTFYGEAVNHLVDMAWLTPGGNYPDGAVLIYSDGGLLYIYEPVTGPEGVTRQRIQGNLQAGMVTLMETFEDEIYLVQRHDNQILTYEPINGIYELPREYFPSEAAPPLREALELGMDGRVYLLMGEGSVRTYFAGAEDLTFQINGLPNPESQSTQSQEKSWFSNLFKRNDLSDTGFKPIVLAVEPDPDGLIYLGDAQHQRIVVLDKRGNFMHQFRLPGEELQRLEAIAVNETPHILYLIADNRLFAAPLPDFVAH